MYLSVYLTKFITSIEHVHIIANDMFLMHLLLTNNYIIKYMS